MNKRSGWRRGIIAAAGVLVAACGLASGACRAEAPSPPAPAVRPGVEVFLAEQLALVAGKRVGLVTNPSGIDRNLESTAGLFRRTAGIALTALYGPEHGVRGNAQAGEYVPFFMDRKFGVPVFSLYGPSMKPPAGMLKDIDAYMRSFDTTHEDKKLGSKMTGDVDVLVFDVQDVGTRVYTYIATMAYAMEAAAEAGIPYIVLDRPDPIDGLTMEGPILDPAFSSFVGLYPIPLRFGMTIGELARLFNDKFLARRADLTVIPASGWRRDMWFDATGLPWVTPSPNMPTLDTAAVYPGQVFFEGTNLSEGRGTTRPFEYFGAPWVDGFDLAKALNALALPGVRFREQWFTPAFSKFSGELCGGCQVHVTDRKTYRPLATTLHIIATLRAMYPDRFAFHAEYFDKIMGTAKVREALEKGTPVAEITAGFEKGLADFAALRKPYLLY